MKRLKGYARAGDITPEELARIQKLAKQPKTTSDAILANVRLSNLVSCVLAD